MLKISRQFLPYLLISLLLMAMLPTVHAMPNMTEHHTSFVAEPTDCHSAKTTQKSQYADCHQSTCLCATALCQLSTLPSFQHAFSFNVRMQSPGAIHVSRIDTRPFTPLERPPQS